MAPERFSNLEVFLFDSILQVPFDIFELAYPCVVFLKNALKLFCRPKPNKNIDIGEKK